jgi:putative transposase
MNPRVGGAYRVGSRSYGLPGVKGVSDEQVYGMAEARVKRLLAFQMYGRYGLDDIASVLVAASSRRVSINQACKDMAQAPDESTVRHHLSKLSMDLLQDRVNHVLVDGDLSILPEKPLKVALDLTPIPYHGIDEGWWVRRGRAKHGTTRFFCYATAYVMLHGRRLTLALKPVSGRERAVEVVGALLRLVEDMGIRIACLFLDRGFYSIDVIDHLKGRRTPFVMPVVRRGRSGGVRRFLKTGKSYTTSYTLRRFRDGAWRQASFKLLVVRKRLRGGGSRCYGYATNTSIGLRRVSGSIGGGLASSPPTAS